jgi:hypothetical protein
VNGLSLVAPTLAVLFFLNGGGPMPITSTGNLGFLSFFLRFTSAFLFFPILVYHTIRQLSIANQYHKNIGTIDLFDRGPLNSFSNLTSKTGMAWILIISINLVAISIGEPNSFVPSGLFWEIITLTEIILAVLAFILPLVGIHNQMADAKSTMLSGIDQRLKSAFDKVNMRPIHREKFP